MLKKNSFGKRTKSIRKPDIAVLVLASLTVLLLIAWGGLYWQDRSSEAAAAQGNDGIELPVIMLNLDAKEPEPEPQPQGSDAGKGNELAAKPEGEAAGAGQDPGKLLEDPAQAPEGAEGASQGTSEPAPSKGTTDSNDGAAQTQGDPSPKPTPPPASKPTPKPAQGSGAGDDKPSKPTPTPVTSEKPIEKPSPSPPSETPAPDESSNDLEQQYELELLGVQAGCAADVKSVLEEAESQKGNVDRSDIEALQRIGNEAALSLEAAGGTCETNFNAVAERASQDGVSAELIEEWKLTYEEVMKQLQAEAELQLLS